MVTSENRFLSRAEMRGNAEYIVAYFRGRGWSVNAIAAMLGNMQSESTINPGIYEGLDASSSTNGFGLVQWTPNTKYKEWANANGYGGDYGNIDGQLARIEYELNNGLQWIETSEYPMSFSEFATSNALPERLAYAFLYNYERPASLDQPNRARQAREWYEYISTGTITPTPSPTRKNEMSKLLLYYAGSKR